MEWVSIQEFPGYSVSDQGLIRNDKLDHLVVTSANQGGITYVGFVKERIQYKRGVSLLVANTFLHPSPIEAFNTPINLNGDRSDNRVENLVWRPRWFAMAYHKQFKNIKPGFIVPVRDKNSREIFPNSFEAAVQNGLLDREIMLATINRTYVWPTFQEFEVVEE